MIVLITVSEPNWHLAQNLIHTLYMYLLLMINQHFGIVIILVVISIKLLIKPHTISFDAEQKAKHGYLQHHTTAQKLFIVSKDWNQVRTAQLHIHIYNFFNIYPMLLRNSSQTKFIGFLPVLGAGYLNLIIEGLYDVVSVPQGLLHLKKQNPNWPKCY